METKQVLSGTLPKWQNKMLPYMIGMVITLALFFFVASFAQLYYLHRKIEAVPSVDINQMLTTLDSTDNKMAVHYRHSLGQWKALASLEAYALERRYHQANVVLMARVWTRYLGFVTGMILSLMGAVFIVGKLRESESRIDATAAGWRFAVTSASPGVILALLGTTLMVVTIVTHHNIEVRDEAVYVSSMFSVPIVEEQGPKISDDFEAELEKVKQEIDAQQRHKKDN